jgi:hypothetical protein
LLLTPDELELLTGKTERAQKRYGSQARELEALGVPFIMRSDRTLIVYRRHVDGQAQEAQVESPAVCL